MSTEPQKALLGAILLDQRVLDRCVQVGTHAGWFCDEWQKVWGACNDLYSKGSPVDLLTVWDKLAEDPSNEITHAALTECVDACVSSANAGHYLAVVREDWRRECAVNLARMNVGRVQDNENIEEICADIQAEWSEFCMGGTGDDTRSNAEVAVELVEKWRDPKANPNDVLWPLEILNQQIGPLTDEIVWLCARESTGKTAFALQICVSLGYKKIRSGFNSLESRRDKLIQRMVSMVGGVNTIRLRRRLAGADEYTDVLENVVPRIDQLPIGISDKSMNVEQIHAWGRHEVARGARLLIVDNARHIRPSRKYGSEVERMMDLSLRLKWVRDETHVPPMRQSRPYTLRGRHPAPAP